MRDDDQGREPREHSRTRLHIRKKIAQPTFTTSHTHRTPFNSIMRSRFSVGEELDGGGATHEGHVRFAVAVTARCDADIEGGRESVRARLGTSTNLNVFCCTEIPEAADNLTKSVTTTLKDGGGRRR